MNLGKQMFQYDCHAHVYEQIATVSGSRYAPKAPATLAKWQQELDKHQLKGGVIVQVSFLGTDNTELCAALEKLDSAHFAGVAVVPCDVKEEEIDRLKALGIRGFRWNLVRGTQIPDLKQPDVRTFLGRIFARDMHIEVHLESDRLSSFIGPLLGFGGKVVVDHLGLPSNSTSQQDPWLQAIKALEDLSGLYVKFSATYRTSFDVTSHATQIAELLPPDHIIWGSDWPHTQHELEINYDMMIQERDDFPLLSDTKAVKTLYGLGD
jgi:predicted TIM-barrel fold metal-dependent hydrolase